MLGTLFGSFRLGDRTPERALKTTIKRTERKEIAHLFLTFWFKNGRDFDVSSESFERGHGMA